MSGGSVRPTMPGTRDPGATAEAYENLRALMFSIAYRMLGTVSEAEDMVQEGFLRYHKTVAEKGQPESPKAYLSAVVTRLCIDHLRSARVRRESYVGEWLPEPLLTGPSPLGQPAADPAELAEQADSLSMAFLLLLERLSPLERAVFLLHEVFSYSYDETAGIVGRNPASCRQLVHRARQHIDADRPRFDVRTAERDELAARFFGAVSGGDMDSLLGLLADGIEVHGDAGGVPPFWRKPITGRDHVGRLLIALGKQLREVRGSLQITEVNGQPGALARGPDGRLIAVLAIDVADGRVQTVRSIISRPKLGHLGPLGNVQELLAMRKGQQQAAGADDDPAIKS
jgi:RNA polymerase sigma-70 factor, ECF subfamily